MKWFLGLDASTQSLSAIIIDLDSGRVVCDESVSFGDFPEYGCLQGYLDHDDPLVKHADPLVWLTALDALLHRLAESDVDLSQVVAISGSGQQHGTVYLNDRFLDPAAWRAAEGLAAMVKPMLSRPTAPIWMDSSTSEECAEIAEAVGGMDVVQKRTGSPPIERFSGPQIRRFFKQHPGAYDKTAVIHLVSSFMASILAGESVAIDHGDGAGMNLLNLESWEWDQELTEATAPGLSEKLPKVVPSRTAVGSIATYFVETFGFARDTQIIAWSGDNPNSLIGVGGYAPGTAVISLGTSHTYFAAMAEPKVDPEGYGHVFGNPAGGYMSLICFKNGALAQEEVRTTFDLDWQQFDDCMKSTPAGNNGNLMVPYFVPEITPLVLDATPVYKGSDAFVAGDDAAARVRAVVEAQALRLRIHSAWIERLPSVVRVTGGASKSNEVCQVLADVFNARVERLNTGNSAGLGAAMRAAEGAAPSVTWKQLSETFCEPVPGQDLEPIPENVKTYQEMLQSYARFASEYSG